jgi:hypothetical protein
MKELVRVRVPTIRLLGISAERPTNGLYLLLFYMEVKEKTGLNDIDIYSKYLERVNSRKYLGSIAN